MSDQEKKVLTRRMPTEGNFMKYDSNDILYSLMYSMATYNPEEKRLYLAKKNFGANKKMIYEACGINGSPMAKRHIDRLKQYNLLSEDNNNYYFPQNPDEKYRLVEKEMLYYLAATRSLNSIRVYMILLDGYLWKEKEGDKFNFTNTYLLEKLGYSITNKNASKMMSDILESFQREGIIKFSEYYETIITSTGKEVPTPKKQLNFVAVKKAELRELEPQKPAVSKEFVF